MAEARLDLLLFGATGVTGLHCIPYMYKLAKENGRKLTWGISGRSEKKLKEALEQMSKKIGVDLSQTPIVLADVKNKDSLLKMAQRAKVVINCCGPYAFLGRPVLEACIAAGTHHVDVSGESEYIDSLPILYGKDAREKGLYVVSACGMDCIPCDLGLVHLQQKFEGVLNSVVAYVTMDQKVKEAGPAIGYGTWQSIIHGLKHGAQLSELKKRLFPQNVPSFEPKLKNNYFPHYSKVVDGWTLPFPGHDKVVAETTQKYLYETESLRPVQVKVFINLKKLLYVIGTILSFIILFFLAQFRFTRQLLLDYPEIFSFGKFSKDKQPSEKVIENTWYELTFCGEGWKEKLSNKGDQYSTPPDKSIVARIRAKNPGYGLTCAGVVGAAIMILTERNKLPPNGGVYTAGIAFRNTSLMKLLMANDMSFDILSQKSL